MKTNNAKELLYRLNVNFNFDLQLLKDAFYEILHIEKNDVRNIMLGSLLTAIMTKGPSEEEVVTLLNTAFSIDGFDSVKRKKLLCQTMKKSLQLL